MLRIRCSRSLSECTSGRFTNVLGADLFGPQNFNPSIGLCVNAKVAPRRIVSTEGCKCRSASQDSFLGIRIESGSLTKQSLREFGRAFVCPFRQRAISLTAPTTVAIAIKMESARTREQNRAS
jgi:hypothetical protein